ncbi:MAG: hypothetical protein ABI402_07195 [Ferruginibacter sp.]
MRAASLKDIKTELDLQPQQVLLGLCLRLAKFKKENKELLTYLLFEENNEAGYVESVKGEVDLAFLELNIKSVYIAKKNLRRILRSINRYIKYSSVKTTEATLLIYFCSKIKASGLQIDKSTALSNIYASQVKKIKTAIATLHEDLQYDFKKELEEIL